MLDICMTGNTREKWDVWEMWDMWATCERADMCQIEDICDMWKTFETWDIWDKDTTPILANWLLAPSPMLGSSPWWGCSGLYGLKCYRAVLQWGCSVRRSSERAPCFRSHRWSILDDPIKNISEIIMHLILFLYIRTVRILQRSWKYLLQL